MILRDKLNRSMRDLRVSVIDACNFRCTYCMPVEEYPHSYAFIRKNDRLSFQEITDLVRIFVANGVSKIRITGGEPLLRKNLPELIKKISVLDGVEDLALTTNGYWLQDYAAALKQAGLRRVTVSLDALNDSIFGKMNGRGIGTEKILAGIWEAVKVGLDPVKVNVLVKRNVNSQGLLEMMKYFKGSDVILRFIEYMDVGNVNQWKFEHVVPSSEILDEIQSVYPLIPMGHNYPGEVAKRFKYVDGSGEIGFISSVSQPFCGSCTRIRLSSDGKIYTCLFARDGVDLMKLLRSDATKEGEIAAIIRDVWERRQDRYSEERKTLKNSSVDETKVEMYKIGG